MPRCLRPDPTTRPEIGNATRAPAASPAMTTARPDPDRSAGNRRTRTIAAAPYGPARRARATAPAARARRPDRGTGFPEARPARPAAPAAVPTTAPGPDRR